MAAAAESLFVDRSFGQCNKKLNTSVAWGGSFHYPKTTCTPGMELLPCALLMCVRKVDNTVTLSLTEVPQEMSRSREVTYSWQFRFWFSMSQQFVSLQVVFKTPAKKHEADSKFRYVANFQCQHTWKHTIQRQKWIIMIFTDKRIFVCKHWEPDKSLSFCCFSKNHKLRTQWIVKIWRFNSATQHDRKGVH